MELWPYRLAVRTPGSHPGNPGTIPGRVTIKETTRFFGVFFLYIDLI